MNNVYILRAACSNTGLSASVLKQPAVVTVEVKGRYWVAHNAPEHTELLYAFGKLTQRRVA